MADDSGDKTEAPTPRRRQEVREEGNIPRSVDLSSSLLLLGAVVLLGVFATQMLGGMRTLMATLLAPGVSENVTRAEDIPKLWGIALRFAGEMAAPIAVGLMALTLATGVIQTGFLISQKALSPKFSRLNPIQGFAQMFSMRAGIKLGMNLAKVSVVVLATVYYVYDDLPKLLSLVRLETEPLLAAAASLVWWLALKIAVLLMILGLIDYVFQWFQHEKDLRMTKQEIKEEYKRMEGDPMVKQCRAKVARQLMMQRLKQDVPKADVIVANPTHFAVALKYDGKDMAAPKVVAKGADYLAMRIREIAIANNIPIVERPPLARALYKHVEVGKQIPAEYYSAVAEILAYVYRLSGRKSA
jgi:flagellar biosynthetic protein FlhB